MKTDAPGIIRWGVFEFDLASGALRKQGRDVRLQEQQCAVLRALVGRAGELVTRDELHAAVWPAGTFVDFDNGLNVAVNRIRDVLGDSASSPRFIETVPRHGYRFIAPVTTLATTNVRPAPQLANDVEWWRWRAVWLAPGLLVGIIIILMRGYLLHSPMAAAANVDCTTAPRLTRLTSFPGVEACPALSPDGEQVAFSWTPRPDVAEHLYVTIVGSADKRQITSGDESDGHAAWSSDGRYVAFVRGTVQGERLYIVSALGGPARRVSEFPAGGQIGWSPDDRYLLSGRSEGPDRGIYAVSVDGGLAHRIVAGPPNGGARAVGLTPDGRRLAYASCRTVSDYGYFDCDADVVPLDASLAPTAPADRLTTMPRLGGLTWTRDGRSLVFFGDPTGTGETRLCRVDVASHKVDTVDAAGITVGIPTTTRANDRLVFVRFDTDVDILAARSGHKEAPFASSSADDGMPAYSVDGARVAFMSGRTGPREIWITDAAGSNPRQLTHGPGAVQQAPRWSPDGSVVAFESRAADGHMHVWTVGSEGSPLRQLTSGTGDEGGPTWSRDGRFVYFGANHGQGYDIWRVPSGGGAPERITTDGSGYIAFESPDGRSILYQQKTTSSPLLRKSLSGGTPRVIVSCASADVFTWHPSGIYYVPCGVRQDAAVHRTALDTGRDVIVATLHGLDMADQTDLAVSADGNTILYVRSVNDARGGDLWMIENFK